MRLVNTKGQDIPESEVDLTKGNLYTKNIIRSDAEPIDDITKFAYTDEDYETVQVYERIPDAELIQRRIEELKQYLSDTDYVVIKIAEGVATAEEYTDVITNRQAWRAEINQLQTCTNETQMI